MCWEITINWEAIGAIVESLGAIGVLATLFYLARQIILNTQTLEKTERAHRANLEANSVTELQTLRRDLYSNPVVTKLWVTGLFDPDALTAVEVHAFKQAFTSLVVALQQQAILGEDLLLDWDTLSKRFFADLFRYPGARAAWHPDMVGHREFSDRVQAIFESTSASDLEELKENPSPWWPNVPPEGVGTASR